MRKVFIDARPEGCFPIDLYRTGRLFYNHRYRPLVLISLAS